MAKTNKKTRLPDDPRPVILTGLIIILITFGGLGTWAVLAKVSAAVIANGQVIVDTQRKTIKHLEGGIVKDILIREGDQVDKGQVLIRLESKEAVSTLEQLQGQKEQQLALQARLKAEQTRKTSIQWPEPLQQPHLDPQTREAMEAQQEVFRSRLQTLQDKQTLYQDQIEQLKSQIKSLKMQSEITDRVVASLKEEAKLKSELVTDKYLDKTKLMQISRDLDSQLAQQSQIAGSIAQAMGRIAELHQRIQDAQNQYVQEAVSRLSQVQARLFELNKRLRPARDQVERLEIKAPVAGLVLNMQIHTPGGVIGPREPLLDIVPGDFPLIVEARVKPQDISQVRRGLEAELVLTAFKRRVTPRAQGTITHVSADTFNDEGKGRPYYLMHIDFHQASVEEAIGDKKRLTPGMPIQVFVKTRSRSVLEYMVEPFTDVMRRAMTER
ncbi:MAG: HlyD family type I secretion periplasmic adaptor subunit [Desulfohalobiaceae bacterium]|nr:HlyD family type I secretion periplasmic adaptor subunit [Desulfohalobiaceae bacterium]